MSKTLNIAAAAALFSSIALGGAFAADGYQPGDGDYFTGVTPPEVSSDNASAGMTPMVLPLDRNSTGSIATDDKDDSAFNPNASSEAGDKEYYEGATPNTK